MEIYPAIQGAHLLWSISLGAALSALWVLFAALCSFFKRRAAVFVFRFFCDLFLVLTAAVCYILLGYYFNKGEVRFFSLLGMCVGFFAFRALLGKLLYKLLRLIFASIFRIFGFILSPLAKLLIKTAKCLQNLAYNLAKVLAKFPLWVYNIYVKIYVLKNAKRGFLDQTRRRG